MFFYTLVSAFQYFATFGVPVLVYCACGISVLNFIFVFFFCTWAFLDQVALCQSVGFNVITLLHLYNKTENSWNFRRPYQLYQAKIRSWFLLCATLAVTKFHLCSNKIVRQFEEKFLSVTCRLCRYTHPAWAVALTTCSIWWPFQNQNFPYSARCVRYFFGFVRLFSK